MTQPPNCDPISRVRAYASTDDAVLSATAAAALSIVADVAEEGLLPLDVIYLRAYFTDIRDMGEKDFGALVESSACSCKRDCGICPAVASGEDWQR